MVSITDHKYAHKRFSQTSLVGFVGARGSKHPRRCGILITMSVPDWDRYFLEICRVVASRSKDPNTQLGCVIVGPAREIRSTGYNSLPRRVKDDVPERLQRPDKYLWIEHAERNAIYNAARAGTPLEHCTIYSELTPCMDCARAIVQAGIVQVVLDEERCAKYSSAQYNPHFLLVGELFAEAGVSMRSVRL